MEKEQTIDKTATDSKTLDTEEEVQTTKYKKLVKTDGQGRVVQISTTAFNDEKGWQVVGEQESRHWHLDITDDDGLYKYEIIDGELVERDTTAEKVALVKERLREAINIRTSAEIALGCPYEDKLIPATDEWESKYLVFIDMAKDGKEFSFELDTVGNDDTFVVTNSNISAISEAVAAFKVGKILEAQAEKRAL